MRNRVTADTFHRALGTLALALVGWQIGSIAGPSSQQPRNAILGITVGAVVGMGLSPYLLTRPHHALKHRVRVMPAGDLLYAIIGLLLGLTVAALLAYPLSLLPWWMGHFLPAVAAAICAYLGITLVTMRRRELTGIVQGMQDSPDGSAEHPGCLVDTSAIIDGRIADITQTGFLRGPLVIPRFVLTELQHIADSADPLRRNRGRRGIEVLNRLQKESSTSIDISDIDVRDVPDVDSKLVKIARDKGVPVVTNDFNLNRIAELQGVRVLNVNQLANALKPVVLPGEEMVVRIIQEGREPNQGVAYLDDGTMIVVENGARHIRATIEVTVSRVLQTSAGRMIFAHPAGHGKE